MELTKAFKYLLSIVVLILFAGYIWLRIGQSRFVHEPRLSFGDTSGYLEIATRPFFSSSFWISSRPPVIPLFFKILDNNPHHIFVAQLWISITSWGILALATMKAIQTIWLKPLGFGTILAFSLVKEIILWDPLILSDSIAISLLALFLASCIWLVLRWTRYRILLFIVASILLIMVRDTYSYFLLMGGGALLVIFIVNPNRRMIFVGGFFLILFITSNAFITAGDRWVASFLNVVGWRILPNPVYLTYFESRGMPVNDALLELKGELSYGKNLAFYEDPRLVEFRYWVKNDGLSEFKRFLWFYKADTIQAPLNEVDEIINPDLLYYAATGYRPIIKNQRLNELLYPIRFGILMFFVSNLIAGFLLFPAFQFKQPMWMIPLMLILFSYPQAILMWNTDPHDIGRHSLYHNIEWRLGWWLIILFTTDFILKRIDISVFRKRYDLS